MPAPGTAVPGAAIPGAVVPGTAVPAPGTTPPPGAVAPGGAVPAPGLPLPGAVAPGAVTPQATTAVTPAPDAESTPAPGSRPAKAENLKKQFTLRYNLLKPLTHKQWYVTLGIILATAVVVAAVAVVAAKLFLTTDLARDFIAKYPGKYDKPDGAPVGIPAWLAWQHFLNMFFLVLIIRTGIQINRTRRPKGYWTSRRGGKKISLTLWLHLSLDLLWVVNGLVFYILLFSTGQWMRIVPTSWEFLPNAASTGLQYLSLDWPTENGWANYNSLQEFAYFLTVFIAAPLSIISGLRMSAYWPKDNVVLNKVLPIGLARAIHMPVMIYYIVFVIIHVFLVFATGALRNLNHMYAGQDTTNWTGFWFFVASLVVIGVGFLAARPAVVAPLAKQFGTVTAR